MPPKGIYKNGRRYWANIPGLGRRPLIQEGDTLATMDYDVATKLYSDWVAKIRQEKRDAGLGLKKERNIDPAKFALQYLEKRAQRKRERRGLRADEPLPKADQELLNKTRHSILLCLTSPVGRNFTTLRQWDEDAVAALATYLKTEARTRRGQLMKPNTVRRILMELSAMFSEAKRPGNSYMSTNPVREHEDVPTGMRRSALDPNYYHTRDEVARLLDNARYSSRNPWAVEQAFSLYYLGTRIGECMVLPLAAFDFERELVHVGQNKDTRSGTVAPLVRDVPFWPVLQKVMRASIEQVPRNPAGLAFPVPGTEMLPFDQQVAMQRLRGTLTSASKRAGLTKNIGHHIARHSYVSARQTMVRVDELGRSRPVSNAEIAAEVGHADDQLILKVYGHLHNPGPVQSVLEYGERDPVPYMREYRKKRKRLARRNARDAERRELRARRRGQ